MIQSVEALGETVGVMNACQALGVPRASLYRTRQVGAQPPAEINPSPRALSLAEKTEVRQVLNSERFQDLAPREVYASLLDEGQ